jgi:hypothetical protein
MRRVCTDCYNSGKLSSVSTNDDDDVSTTDDEVIRRDVHMSTRCLARIIHMDDFSSSGSSAEFEAADSNDDPESLMHGAEQPCSMTICVVQVKEEEQTNHVEEKGGDKECSNLDNETC